MPTSWMALKEPSSIRTRWMPEKTGMAQATLDDQFDSAALLSLGFDTFSHVEDEDFFTEEEQEFERGFWNSRRASATSGRSAVTGY